MIAKTIISAAIVSVTTAIVVLVFIVIVVSAVVGPGIVGLVAIRLLAVVPVVISGELATGCWAGSLVANRRPCKQSLCLDNSFAFTRGCSYRHSGASANSGSDCSALTSGRDTSDDGTGCGCSTNPA
jgi:hypothetical protein